MRADAGRGVPVRLALGAGAGAIVVWQSWDASTLDRHRWAAVATVVVMTAVAAALPVVGRRLPTPGHVPALIGVSQFAIYCCVPETGKVGETLVAIVVIAAIELATHRPMAWWAHATVATLVLWSGVFGATGRESALVGALFAWWPIVLVVVMPHRALLVAIIGSIAAVAVARTGALEPTPGPALLAVAVAVPFSCAVGAAVSHLGRTHPVDRRT